ncbi:hypothetical protein EDB89DRAFT_750396 [Lactarius sanguifluus]|nr:hypothetical protein EDB89DRAFT_750396 [Lactarius sanguifluus]
MTAICRAGAARLSAALALSKHPDKSLVTVFNEELVASGTAISIAIDSARYDALRIINEDCSPALANTLCIFCELRYLPETVDMQRTRTTSFPLTERLAHDIRKFGRVLKTVKPLEGGSPIYALLRLFGHSKEFGERMCIRSPCFIFGTGNQTLFLVQFLRSWWTLSVHPRNVRKERVFKNPSMHLFEYDARSFANFQGCMHSRRSAPTSPGNATLNRRGTSLSSATK